MFPQLGRAISAAFRRVAGSIEVLTELLARGRGAEVIAAAHTDGRRVARVTQGVLFRVKPTLSPAEARLWRESAMRHGTRAVTLAAPVLEAAPTRATLAAYANLVLRQAVWVGNDVEATRIAEEHAAAWKMWVRAFPRTEHRDHHDALEGRIIPTDALFTLPGGRNAGAEVYGPRDWRRVRDPGEWIECGHALRFQQTARRREVT